MTMSVLQTKLFVPPLNPHHISRPHLLEKLATGLQKGCVVTLVSAPAGYGKTSLIAEWGIGARQDNAARTAARAGEFCWLSLDGYDDDPNRFWQYFLASLQSAFPTVGSAIQRLLSATPLPSPPALLTGLLNELAALPQAVVLVLDDLQVISDASLHEGLEFLVDHAPPQLHLVLITRADPPWSLARLRGRGLLNEIRVADLRFTVDEAAVFLQQEMDLPLSSAEIGTVESRTEGWVTGLQLTAASLRGRADVSDFIASFGASQFYILEYLAAEVLQQQTEAMQAFLLQTSILSELSAALCDAVTGRDDSRSALNELVRQNLFLSPLDEERRWFRTHHLLADLLKNRLRQTVPSETIKTLHMRASRWYEAQGRWEPAVAHAIEAEAWEVAADQIDAAYPQLLAQGRIATWQRWLARIPRPVIESRPSLVVRQGWASFLRGEFKQAEFTLLAARQSLRAQDLNAERRALFGELATYLATVAFFHEESERIIEAAEEALAYLPPDAVAMRARATGALGLGVSLAGDTRQAMDLFQEAAHLARLADNPFLLAHSLEVVADSQFHMAQLHAAAATCREIIALARQENDAPLPFAGNGHIKLAAIYTEWRELPRAEEEMAAGFSLNREGGIGYNLLQDYCSQVRLRQASGDQAGALTALRQAEAIFQQNRSKIRAVQLAACAIQFWLNAGDVDTAASWAEGRVPFDQPMALEALPAIGREVWLISLARVRLAQQRPDDVLRVYDQLREQVLASGRLARVIEITLLGALAQQMKRDEAKALAMLREVLPITEQQNYVQSFVELGEPMRRLLGQIAPAERSSYVQDLIAAFPDATLIAMAALVEPLSPRELEVLRLIHGGLSNKAIAAELNVSLNTVKKHTTHIYGKLGVNGRTQAIARARELNLL